MGNKRNIIIAAVLALLSVGLNVANADNTNSLLQMDVKKSATTDTVDVIFYTTGAPTNSVVTKKSNNRYVVLLPNTESSSSIAPSIGGVKDLITDVDVKHVNDGIGGYTKVTFGTTKPINIKTYTKKTNPLTQAQKDTKAIIAKNNTTPAVQPSKAQQSAVKPVANVTPVKSNGTKAQAKPAVQTTTSAKPVAQPKATTTQKASTPVKEVAKPKLTMIEVPKPKLQDKIVKTKVEKVAEQVKPNAKPSAPATKTQKTTVSNSDYVPKMKFDANGKRMIDLEPRVSHSVVAEKPTKSVETNPLFAIDETSQAQVLEDNQTQVSSEAVAVDTPLDSENTTNHFPIWILIVGGSVLALGALYLVFDAIAHANAKDKSRLNSFFTLSSKNQAKRRRREYYDIVNNSDLSWQEKYKSYKEKEESRKPKKNPSDMSYVTDMSGLKKAIVMPVEEKKQETSRQAQPTVEKDSKFFQKIEKSHDDIVREKLQAKISQMEHSLAQTPTVKEPEETSNEVKSEDNAIINKISDIKLKSFSKPTTLKETHRSLIEDDKKISRNKSYKEGRFVKLKNSPLSVSRRKSASSDLKTSDLIGTGSKYLTNNNGETKMNKENENYLLSSLDEYLSILDSEGSSTAVAKSSTEESLAKIKPSSEAMSRSGVTNPISRGSSPIQVGGKKPLPYMNGLIVKSGYNIDSEKGFYLVNIDGVSALVGRINDDIFILKKFDHVVDSPLQVRPDDRNVYIVRVGKFKCLVDVSKDKMGTLIEI